MTLVERSYVIRGGTEVAGQSHGRTCRRLVIDCAMLTWTDKFTMLEVGAAVAY
eukprot:COSAG01_NODE_5859_length_3987_cov_80.637088_6_plen_53_part_00